MADDHKLRQLDFTGEQGYAAWTLKQRPTALSCLRALQKKLSSSRNGTPDWASGTAWVADRHYLVTRIATPPSGDGVAAQHVPAAAPHGGASASALTKPAGAPPAAVAAQAAQPAALVGAAPAQLPAAAAAAADLQADLQGQQVRAARTQHAPPTAAAPLAASSGALQVARRPCDMQKRRADNLQAALEASRVEIAQLHNCVATLRKACEASKAGECALRVDLKAARSQLGKETCTDVSVQAGVGQACWPMSSIAWLALVRRSVVIREHCRSSRSVLRKSSRAQRAQLQPVSSIIVRHWQPKLKPYRSRKRPGRVRCAVQLHRLAVLADALQRPVPLQWPTLHC